MKLERGLLVLVIAGMLGCPWPASATEFGSPKSYPVGTNPSAVVVADFNGDGKPDIAVVNSGSNNVSILIGNGDGTFQPAKNFDVGNSMTGISAGDFNGDGKLDLAAFQAVGSSSVAGVVAILLGNGDGTFQAPVATTLTIAATTLNVADFNGDKKADLVLSNVEPGTGTVTLEIFIGKGDGTFQAAKEIPAPSLSGSAFAIADFNKDGKPDLAVSISGGAQVLLGNGDGTFQAAGGVTLEPNFNVASILTGDINGDGQTDLIVNSQTTVEGSCGTIIRFPCQIIVAHIEVFFGQGNGQFGSDPVTPTGSAVALGDFNGDGKGDLVLTGFGVLLGKGDGTFTVVYPVASPIGLVGFAADLNGDKQPDLVSLDSPNNAILVLLNSSPTSGADLGIASAGSGREVGQGLNLTYSADVLNEGPKDATNVTFTDTLPSSVAFVSATSTTGSCIQSNLVVTCNIGSLADVADAQITIVVTPTTTGTITNSMDVSATEPDLALANNSATQIDTVVPVYTLTVTKNGSGTGAVESTILVQPQIKCGSVCSGTYLSGATLHLNVISDSSSTFQGWGGACSGNETPCSVIMNSNLAVTATFVANPTLSVKFAGGGTGSVTASDGSLSCTNTGGPCSSQYAPGSSVSLTAATSAGSTFAGWSGACIGMDPNTCSITLNASQSVTATFNPPPDFSVNPVSKSLTAQSGGQVTDVISISEQGGFSSAIQLSCSVTGPAPLPSCSLSPNSIPPGANSPTSTLTFGAGKLAAYLPVLFLRKGNLLASLLPVGLLGCVLLFGFEKPQQKQWALYLLILIAAMLPVACGGGSTTRPPVSQTYVVIVTAASGALQHSTAITVTVQ
jgi:uncharacterized repeat protein (TIGR01451 family)